MLILTSDTGPEMNDRGKRKYTLASRAVLSRLHLMKSELGSNDLFQSPPTLQKWVQKIPQITSPQCLHSVNPLLPEFFDCEWQNSVFQSHCFLIRRKLEEKTEPSWTALFILISQMHHLFPSLFLILSDISHCVTLFVYTCLCAWHLQLP